MAVYLKALVFWRSKKFDEAGKLFIAMPPATHWSAAASTLGGALCFAVSGKAQQGIDLLEKHLDTVDDDPLIEDQFVLLDQLYASVGTSDTTMLKRWAEGSSHPSRARIAAFYQAKGELRLKHIEAGETLRDDEMQLRLVTSFRTSEAEIERFVDLLAKA